MLWRSTAGRNGIEALSETGAEYDGSCGIPCPTRRHCSERTNRFGQTFGNRHFLQRIVGKETNKLAIGRPKWLGSSLGPGYQVRVQCVERPEPKSAVAFRPDRRERKILAVRRDRGKARVSCLLRGSDGKLENRSRRLLTEEENRR